MEKPQAAKFSKLDLTAVIKKNNLKTKAAVLTTSSSAERIKCKNMFAHSKKIEEYLSEAWVWMGPTKLQWLKVSVAGPYLDSARATCHQFINSPKAEDKG